MDDEPMWAADRVVAPTPGSAITIPETKNEFAIKDEGISNTDTDKIMARMDAMTIKMDAQYKELQSRAKQPSSDLNDDDIPMSREEETKCMQTFRKTRFYNDYRDRDSNRDNWRSSGRNDYNRDNYQSNTDDKPYDLQRQFNDFMKSQQSTNAFVKETFMDLKTQLETVAKNHQASIQNLKTKFNRLADKQSGRPSRSLPSNTQPNPRGSNSKAYQPPQARNEHVNAVFTRSADLGASINLMPYSLNAKLSLETLKPTKMSVRLADKSFQYPVGIAENMLVEVGKFTFPGDFFENFVTASNETLDKAYDRFQELISQLEIHRAYVSKEDINQKFLRSLPPSWSQIALIMRNKPDIDEVDIDDLYNNLRVYEDELKMSSGSNSASQNLVFLSFENTNSTNEVSIASGDFGVSTAGGINQVPSTPSAHDIAYSFLAQPTTSPQLENEDFQHMDGDDLEELDLRWQVAMLTVRVKKHWGSRGIGGYDWSNDFEVEPVNYALMGFLSSNSSSSSDSKVQKCSKCLESFKCLQKNYDTEREKHNKAKLEIRGYEIALESLEARILGHEKNELAWGERYEFQNYDLKCREIKINNLNLELEKVVKERDELKLKIEKWEGSSKNLTKILNSQMSTRDKNVLGFGIQMDDLSNKSETDSENSLTIFEVRSSDEESTLANNRFTKANEYHVVPPPITGNPLTPRADISFAGLDEYAFRNKIIESKTTETNKTVGTTNEATIVKPKSVNETVVSKSKINRDETIIEDWTSDDEDDMCAVKTVSSVKPNVGSSC
ncbi:reverse transcriptase domain-containing protein [Tanacetum coccineum]